MARQKEPEALVLRFVAVDPGEAWMGFAALEVSPLWVRAETRVIDVRRRCLVASVVPIVQAMPATVIAEDYRQRPVGYQRFSEGMTLRLLGALQYATQLRAHEFSVVQPGRIDDDLDRLGIGGHLDNWTARGWPKSKHWEHARSAWRVLGTYLLQRHTDILVAIRGRTTPRAVTLTEHWLALDSMHHDVIAPAAFWELRR